MSRMELRQLRYFAAVALHRHFTRAAEELHVAQPALSQQIRRLERELGLELFVRSTRRVALTEAGELLLPRAQRVMAELDDARAELEQLTGLIRGRVGVGAIPLAPLDLPGMLAEFRGRHPGVAVYMREETLDGMLAMLRTDELDLGFAFADEETVGPELATELLFQEELVVVTAPGHPLADRKRLRLDALAGEPLIGFRRDSVLRRTTDRALAAAGVAPESAFETIELETMRALVARGLGVTIMPRGYLEGEGPRVAQIEARPALRLPVSLVWRAQRRRPPAAEEFLDFARTRLASQPKAAVR
jgi:LysR family transcriptional regulator, transcription activator of glutamate synthase operon